MGTLDRPGQDGESTPFGPSILDQSPDNMPGFFLAELTEEDINRIIASDPCADDPHLNCVTFTGETQEISLHEWAVHSGYTATPPLLPGAGREEREEMVRVNLQLQQAKNTSASYRVALLDAVRACVPDLPLAPRGRRTRAWLSREAAALEDAAHWSPTTAADALANLDPGTLDDNDLLDYLHAAQRVQAWAQSRRDTALAAFTTRRPPLEDEKSAAGTSELSMWAAAEIMAVLAIGHGRSQQLLNDAQTLTRHLPETFRHYSQGLLDPERIRAIHHGILNVPLEVLPVLEQSFLPGASRMNPAALTRKIRRLADSLNPEPLTDRHERARTSRSVWLTPLPDGMAQLSAILPAATAVALYESLDAWARAAQRTGTPSHGTTPTGRPARNINEYRADAMIELLHQAFLHPNTNCTHCECDCDCNNGDRRGAAIGARTHTRSSPETTGYSPRIPAKISVTVPVMTLLGLSEEPGNLEGYGPIPPDQARELAAGASSWQRILTHPETGTILSIGRHSYRPPADMARLVRLKNPTCTGIGCDHPANSCELDHTIPFYQDQYRPDGTLLPKGETSTENLRPRSRYCHQLKDNPHTGWTVEPAGPGITKTTTPTNRTYYTTTNDTTPPF